MTGLDSSISREKIEEAKQKLGDRNAEIIAAVMNIQKYNPQRRIGCCPNPAHHDDTPSFSFNPKACSFYCFGCHTTVDVIDAWMSAGDTFLQACEKLFREADMPYNFSYRGIPSDRDYVYPKPEWAETKETVYDYWQKRCISPATIDALGIMEDLQGNTCFPYYDDSDVLRCVKIRPSRAIRKGIDKQKCWWLKPSDTMHILFNQNRINVSQPLIICTGEGDCAAAYEAGCTNVTSVPMGDSNTQWIAAQWDWLQQFSSIIIVHDNDESGRKYLKEVTRRLGEYRCRIVEIPETWTKEDGTQIGIKDLNEYLFHAGAQAVRDAINNAREREIETVIDYTKLSDFSIDDVDGIHTGFAELDASLGKIHTGTLNLITGITGSGKSSFISTLIAQSIEQGFPVWAFSAELSNQLFKSWVDMVQAGQPNLTAETVDGRTVYRIKPEAAEKMRAYYEGQLYIYRDSAEPTAENILNSLEASVKRYGVRTAFIDNLMTVMLPGSEQDRWAKQDQFIRDCTRLAQKLDIVLFLALHPKKMDSVRPMGLFDLAGVTSSANLAHRVFSLYRVQESDREPGRNGKVRPHTCCDVALQILKDRFGSAGMKTYDLFYDIPTRRFFDTPETLAFQYSWDKAAHKEPLPYFDMQRYLQVSRREPEPF